jgi:uncharacterized membrane protein YgcG
MCPIPEGPLFSGFMLYPICSRVIWQKYRPLSSCHSKHPKPFSQLILWCSPMKRSTQVAAPLLAAAALSLLTGCRPEMQRCVDENNHVVADSLCDNQPNQHPVAGTSAYPILLPFHYYYGGWGGYGIGSVVGGGSTTPSFGRSYATKSGRTIRGGFGSSFSEGGSYSSGEGSHGGGAGE